MDYKKLIDGMKRFGADETDICIHGLGILPNQIQDNVVLAPWWEPATLSGLGEAEYLSKSDLSAVKIWNVVSGDTAVTYIKTGMGAPVLMDALLALGVTPCKRVLFIGSAGALSSEIEIGDIVIPEYSICGDGASRYISYDSIKDSDVFGKKSFPDSDLLEAVKNSTKRICMQNNVKWHMGKTYSIDTIFAQYAHIDEILQMGCNVIEMETAAAFYAAQIANIPTAAIFCVSDNTISNKSLVSGRTEEEMGYRKYVRRELFPKIILETLHS